MYRINYKKLYWIRQLKLEFGLWIIASTFAFVVHQLLFRESYIFSNHWIFDILYASVGIFGFSVMFSLFFSTLFLVKRIEIQNFKTTMLTKVAVLVGISIVVYFCCTTIQTVDTTEIRVFPHNYFGYYIALISVFLTYILNNLFHQMLVIRPNFKKDRLVDKMN